MPNVAALLKAEIARVARKEVRSELARLKAATARHRSEIASLKRELEQTRKELRRLGRSASKAAAPKTPPASEGKSLRFSAERFAGTREKLGLSAREMALLLGASALSVYKWEKGQARPRAAQLASIASVGGMGKREAQAKLEQLAT